MTVCYKKDADCKRCQNKNRHAQLSRGGSFCDVVLHLFGLGKKCLRTRVDLRFPLLTGVIEHDVLDAFNAVQKKGVEACKFRTVSHAGGF